MKRFFAFLLPLAALLSSPLLAAADSTAPPPCANACYNYLSQLASQAASSGNAAIQTLQGSVTPAQVVSMCDAAKPLDCCACGAPGTPGVDVLDRWTLACATLAVNPQDGGTTAAACFNSGGTTSCTDYGGLLEGANCTTPVVGSTVAGNSTAPSGTSAAGNLSATAATGGATHTPNSAMVVTGVGFLGWSSFGIAVWLLGVA
jgi:hypothetical protein